MANTLNGTFFEQDPREAAKDILGRIIIRKTTKGIYAAEIVEAGAYIGGEDTPSRRGMLYNPGQIFIMQHRGSNLLNIASGSDKQPMACVEIREIALGNKIISGSGSISAHLGLDSTFDNKFLGDESGLYISRDKYRVAKIIRLKEEGSADNCTGIYSIRGE